MSDKDGAAPSKLLLKDLIDQVRGELAEAVAARKKSPGAPDFVVEDITLEVNFVVESSGKASGGAKASLFAVGFEAGAEKNYRTEQVHKVTLKLTAWDGEKRATGDPNPGSEKLNVFKSDFTYPYVFNFPGVNITGKSPIGKIRVDPVDVFGELPTKPEMTLDSINEQLQSKGYCLMPSDMFSWWKKD